MMFDYFDFIIGSIDVIIFVLCLLNFLRCVFFVLIFCVLDYHCEKLIDTFTK